MREFEDYDAKFILFELLEAARQGETVVITHHGNPVAHLCPVPFTAPTLGSQRNLSEVGEKAGDDSNGGLPQPGETASGSLRDLMDWRRYGRR